MDIAAWLRSLGLAQYERAFHDHGIDATILPRLTAEDLKEAGVTAVGHRRRLLDAIAALGDGTSAAALPPAPPTEPEPEAERRHVTVLFADLAGYTTLSRELDPEQVHTLLGQFFEAVDGVVEAHGGMVDKHVGDCVMAVFGAPLAHGDDPERAVRAALAIHAAVRRAGEAAGRPLAVHVGVASGQVVAGGTGSTGHRQYTVTGEAANLASRLTGLAGSGDTLLADGVRRLLADRLDAEVVGEVVLKGLDRPVRAWRLRGLRDPDVTSRLFVGRQAELAQLGGALAACLETGRGLAIRVRGEAGIGKTRLVEELRKSAAGRGFVCHTGLVLDFGTGKGRDAVRSLVHRLLGLGSRSTAEEAERAAERAFAEGLVDPERRVHLLDLLDLPQPPDTRALYDAMDNATRNRGKRETVAGLVRRLADRRPLLLVLEDLHWADPATLAHAAELAATAAGCATVLVLTSRLGGDPVDAAWRGATHGAPMLTIDLGPLRPEDAAAFAGSFDVAEPLLATCVERSGGHPLFLEQLLRGAEEIGAGVLPGSVQGAVLARVDTLAPADKRAVQAASVLGQRFAPEALRHLVGDPRYGADRLVAHYLVRLEGQDLLFVHALIREGIYASLLHARRRELHRRAAAWYAERDPVLHAEHLDHAEDPAAPGAYLRAARVEAAAYRQERARRLAGRGLALAREVADRCALSRLNGELLHDLGEIPASIVAYEEALELAGGAVERCRALLGLAAGLRVTDEFDRAFRLLEEAESAAATHGLAEEMARVHYLRGNLYFPRGNLEGCRREHEAALAHARAAGSPELEARALSGLGDASYMSGRMATAHEHFRGCLALAREHGLGRVEVANLYMLAGTGLYMARLEEARSIGLAAIEAARRVGHRRAELNALQITAYVLFEMGETAPARELLTGSLELVRQLRATRFEPIGLVYLAKILAGEGRHAEAVELLDRAWAVSREGGAGFTGPWVLGAVALLADEPEVRREALEEGERLLRAGSVSHNHLWFRRDAMEACLRAGDWAGVERHAAALEDYTRPEPLPWADLHIARARALAAFGQGSRDAALLAELRRLRGDGERHGLKLALAGIMEALAGA